MDLSGGTDNIWGRSVRRPAGGTAGRPSVRAHRSVPPAVAARTHTADQRGVALVEVLLAMAIMSILFVTLALGMVTSVRASSTVNDHQRAETVLSAYAEALKQLEYQPCATAEQYEDAYEEYDPAGPGPRATAEITGIDFGGAACSGTAPDGGTQTLNLRTEYKDIVAHGQITKRDPDAVPPAPNALNVGVLTVGGQCPCDVVNGDERFVGLELSADHLEPGNGYARGTEITSYEWTVDHRDTTTTGTGKSYFALVEADDVETTADVTLKVTDSRGDSDEATCSVKIPPANPVPQPPMSSPPP